MVPRKEGEATNQTEPDAYGIHDNPVSGSHPPRTVTLTSQWKHKYLIISNELFSVLNSYATDIKNLHVVSLVTSALQHLAWS